ncbi:cell division cycle-associated protein 2 isoform X1 [Octodon degus]|nr:cell division cycle-associated protein 2 isoform X1 [Octodon degus]
MAPCAETSEAEEGPEVTGFAKKEDRGGSWKPGFPGELSSKRRKITAEGGSEDGLSLAGHTGSRMPRADVDRAHAAGPSVALAEVLASKKSPEHSLTKSGCVGDDCVPCPALAEASAGPEVADWMEGTGRSDAVPLDTLVTLATVPAAPVCRGEVPSTETIVLRSVLKKPCTKLSLESLEEHKDDLCANGTRPRLASHPLNCCKEHKAKDEDNCEVPAFPNTKKRKRVTFGEELSPEVFDESLPANTPLRKGGTPARLQDLHRRSPQLPDQSPVPEPLPQPDFDDKGENLENIEPLEISFAVQSPIKPSISETLSGTDAFNSSNIHRKLSSCKVAKPTRTSNRRNQPAFTEENGCNLRHAEAQPCKEKKINRKSQETKCTSRAFPKKKQMLKGGRKKKRKGKKSVEKSLYGERELASKKPLLSPIPELPEVSEAPLWAAGVCRLRAGAFSSAGKLGDVELLRTSAERRGLLLWPPDLRLQRGLHGADASELCRLDETGSSLPAAPSREDAGAGTGTEDSRSVPQAEKELQPGSELRTELEAHRGPAPRASASSERPASAGPSPDPPPQCPEGAAAAGPSAESLCRSLEAAQAPGLELEQQEDFLVATAGKLQRSSSSVAQEEFSSSEDVTRKRKSESEGHGEPAESGSAPGRGERKRGRRSVRRADGHCVWSQPDGSRSPSRSVESTVAASLQNAKLYHDLSDAIEQALQSTSSETKVRRSTRLQRDPESQGLVWLAVPFPSASQKARRRTSCTLDSRELQSSPPRKETEGSGQDPGVVGFSCGDKSSEGPAAAPSRFPRKRRKSLCVSELPSACRSTGPAPTGRGFPQEKAESSQRPGPGEN